MWSQNLTCLLKVSVRLGSQSEISSDCPAAVECENSRKGRSKMEARSRTTLKILPLVIAGVVILFQFLGAEKFTNPETGRTQRVAFSPQQEEALGLQAYQEVLSTSDVIESGREAE